MLNSFSYKINYYYYNVLQILLCIKMSNEKGEYLFVKNEISENNTTDLGRNNYWQFCFKTPWTGNCKHRVGIVCSISNKISINIKRNWFIGNILQYFVSSSFCSIQKALTSTTSKENVYKHNEAFCIEVSSVGKLQQNF